jgi:DNA relaxase NicK
VSKTTIDWLRFRTQAQPLEGLEAVKSMYGALGGLMKLRHLERGMDGFKQGAEVVADDLVLGRVDYGGDSQRGWVRWNLPGKGCGWVQDWDAAEGLEELDSCELRRVDIALTTWHGEVSHDAVVEAHQAGRFTTRGRPPELRQITSSNPRAGRTCYVGKRGSDKLGRFYEKGFEMLRDMPEAKRAEISKIDGCQVEDIYRCEIELQSETRPVPWEVIARRDQYFAGSYPFCADVLPDVDVEILKGRPERQAQWSLEVALETMRHQWGATLKTAIAAYHGDIGTVFGKIVGEHHNQALLDAGVLLVEHE